MASMGATVGAQEHLLAAQVARAGGAGLRAALHCFCLYAYWFDLLGIHPNWLLRPFNQQNLLNVQRTNTGPQCGRSEFAVALCCP